MILPGAIGRAARRLPLRSYQANASSPASAEAHTIVPFDETDANVPRWLSSTRTSVAIRRDVPGEPGALDVERLGEELRVAHPQERARCAVARRRVQPARERRDQPDRFGRPVERSQIDAVVLRLCAPDEEQEFRAAGQRDRPVVRVLAAARVERRHLRDRAASLGHAMDHAPPAGVKRMTPLSDQVPPRPWSMSATASGRPPAIATVKSLRLPKNPSDRLSADQNG